MNKVAITTSSFAKYDKKPLRSLKEKGLEVLLNPHGRKLTKGEVIAICKDVIGIIAGTESLDKDIIGQLRNLRVISRCGVGLDNVDLETTKRLGIKVFITPDAPTIAVAELTVALMLSLLRKINDMHCNLKNGRWKVLMGNLMYRKKIGIIGFGRIGQKVSEFLSAFGAELAYCDVEPKSSPVNCSKKNFEEILSWADIITLHLSISKKGRPIIGTKELNLMKRGSWLVNVSRGGVVDEGALYRVLKNGHLSGAAVDVFEKEPYEGPLKELNNILLTPHSGSYAREARIKMEKEAVENLIKGLKGVKK